MRVIPVIDLLGGFVVRGIGGRRDEYRPIQSRIAKSPRPGDVAAAFAQSFGFTAVYVADLGAIMHGRPDTPSWQEIARAGLEIILDAGIGSCDAADRARRDLERLGVKARLVIGLESLGSVEDLAALRAQQQELIFSLDLKAGRPLCKASAFGHLTPVEIAGQVCERGIREIIVLDLADVGTGGGTRTLGLCRAIRAAFADLKLIAGGGVRGAGDLAALAEAGCDGALVASALHDGALVPADMAMDAEFFAPGASGPRWLR